MEVVVVVLVVVAVLFEIMAGCNSFVVWMDGTFVAVEVMVENNAEDDEVYRRRIR
jgi:hypothetical protein